MEELVKKLKSDSAFQEFTEYVISKIEELDTVVGLERMSNDEAGEEAKIRSRTRDKLYEILRPFIDFKEKREPTEKEIKKAQEKYGL